MPLNDSLQQRVATIHSADPQTGRVELAAVCAEHVGSNVAVFMRQQQDHEGVFRYADVLVHGPMAPIAAIEGQKVIAGSAHDASDSAMGARRGRWSLQAPAARHTNCFSVLRDDVDPERLHELPVMRQIYTPNGIVDQARMLVVDRGRVVAWFGILKTSPQGLFERNDLLQLNRASKAIAHALICLDAADQWDMDNGMAMMRGNGALMAATPDVAAWLVASRRDLVTARVRAIDAGGTPMVFAVGRALVRATRLDGPEGVYYLLTFRAQQPQVSAANQLTPRQRDIADLAVVGMTVEEISATLSISANTVKTHLRAVYEILHVANRVELARALAE